MPERIQLRRTDGWRKPEGAVVVSRPSKWGNPYRVGEINVWTGTVITDREEARSCYATELLAMAQHAPAQFDSLVAQMRRELAGHDLACWCPLVDEDGQPVPCHADVLLTIANHEVAP